jgi:uncharacterized membrane protein
MELKHLAPSFLLFAAHSLFAASAYQVQGIPLRDDVLGTQYPAISQSHQVAFTTYSPAADPATPAPVLTPYLWSEGQLTQLPVGGNAVSAVTTGVNSAGTVVGYTIDAAGNYNPVVWANGSMTHLALGGMQQGAALAINDNNEIAGRLYNSSGYDPDWQAATWSGGGVSNLGDFGAGPGIGASAVAINNHSDLAITTTGNPLLYNNGQITPITGFNSPQVDALNDLGQVAFQDGSTLKNYLWQNGSATLLASLPGTVFADPIALNNKSQLVGFSEFGPGPLAATLWEDGSAYDLNTLIDPNSGWLLSTATGITDDGTIVGMGSYDGQGEIFLLTPTSGDPSALGSVPEPTTLSVLALAMLPLHRRRR